jgi:hypothetical protein
MVVVSADNIVTTVNGYRVEKTGWRTGWTGGEVDLIWDYLNLRGSEGWELVTAISNQYGKPITFMLKRLTGQEAS